MWGARFLAAHEHEHEHAENTVPSDPGRRAFAESLATAVRLFQQGGLR
jgi:hypothetical protein